MTAQSGLGFSGIVAIQIPDDGAPGTVLTKLTADNYDYDWLPGGGGGAPDDAEYVVMSLNATLTNERVLTAGTGITIVDGGAGGNVTISFNAATAGYTLQDAYDAATAVPQITLNATPDPVTIDASVAGDIFALRDAADTDVFRVSNTSFDWGDSAQRAWNSTLDYTGRPFLEYVPDNFTQTTLATLSGAINWSSVVTAAVPGGGGIGNDTAPNFVTWNGEVILTEQGNLFNTQSLFNQASVITCQGASTGPIYTMINQPLLRVGSTGGARTGSQQNAVRSQLRIGPNIAGTFTLASHEPYFATMIMDGAGGAVSVTTANYFAPKAPTLAGGATVGTLNLIDFPNIPAAGITNLRGINSAMVSGTFINHTGSAPAIFNGNIQIDADLFGLQLGESQDITLGWGAANFYFWQFNASTDQIRWSNPSTNRYILETENGNADGELNVGMERFSFGQTGAVGNQVGNFVANARTIGVAGDWADFLLTQAGSLTVGGLAMGRVSAWVINGISYAASTGSVSNADTLTVGGMVTSSPGVTITERQSLHVIGGRSRFLSALQYDPINPAALNSGNNNDWAGLLTGTANNGMRHWARIQGNATTSVLTGIDATSAQDGDTFELTNVSANAIDISDQDVASVAANRIITPTGVTYVLGADETVIVRYDSTTARWRLLAGTGA